MSKGSLLCALLLLQVCFAQLSAVSSWQLPGGQAGAKVLRRDPIRRAALFMSGHGRRGELGSHSADDSIFDEEEELADEGLDALDEYASDDDDVPAEEEDGWLPHDGGGDSGGAKDSSSGGSGGDVECPECGKFFRNKKSMFGHLRSHPNKGYRGATPPMNKLKMLAETAGAPASSSSPDNHDDEKDEPPALPSRRDRQVTLSDKLCGYVMLTLKYRDVSQPSEPSQQVPLPAPAPAPSFAETKVDSAEQETPGKAMDNAIHCGEHSGSIAQIPRKRRNVFKPIRERRMKKVKFLSAAKEKCQYFCKHCNAEFSTHQALGGHMAGHHREKKVLALNDSSSRVQKGMAAQSLKGKLQVKAGGDDDDDAWRDSGLSLQRGMLSEKLSMEKHVERRSDGLTPAVPAPTQAQADDRGGRRPLNIDLNAAAPEQE